MAIALRPQICDVISPYIYGYIRDKSDALNGMNLFTVGKQRRMGQESSHNTSNIACQWKITLECGPMPNVMVALPNIGGDFCSTPQSLADAHYWMPCSNAAKTRNPLKFAGVPQSTGSISAVGGPKFTILWGHVEDILLLNKFFSDCRYVP